MAVKKINTNKITYDKIQEFLPKIKGKPTVGRDIINEMYDIANEAGYLIPTRISCTPCTNSQIVSYLRAYAYQYEHPEE